MFKEIQNLIKYWKAYAFFTFATLVMVFGFAFCAPEPDANNSNGGGSYRNPSDLMNGGQ